MPVFQEISHYLVWLIQGFLDKTWDGICIKSVRDTVARVQRDVPQAVVTALPDCGHFLQEEAGPQIGELLAEFFAAADPQPQ